jgi:UDP-N-acetylmuramoyl-L-alanyl-D-glutamate--2,6-diaminopimelate ligase
MWQKIKNVYHLGMAIIANLVYNFPSKKLITIGVTGTDGKTTTVALVYHILKEAGFNSSMISTVGAIINNRKFDVGFHVTTPSPFALQKFLSKALVKKNNEKLYMVLETTSHSLDQHRTFGVNYDIGILTNVTHEHLDYHKTYENYVRAKTKLLQRSKVAIVNIDHKQSYEIIKELLRDYKGKIVTYGRSKNADINPIKFPFKTKMIGDFSVYNCLAAIAAVKSLGVKDSIIRKAILSFKPPIGREEIVYKKRFSVMIDFAHTPNAFRNILTAVRPKVKGRIIHVFGAAGLRDQTKRPIMGKTSSKYVNVIFLTSEDPRTELVAEINAKIKSGITNKKVKIFEISDRKEAIREAIKIAKKDDLVLITGKSHEKSMNYGHGETPWDEFEVVKEALRLKHE